MAKAIRDRVSLISRKREQRQQVRAEQEKRKQEEEQKPLSSESIKNVAGVQGTQGSLQSQCSSQPPTPGLVQPECEEPDADLQHQYMQSAITCECSVIVFLSLLDPLKLRCCISSGFPLNKWLLSTE